MADQTAREAFEARMIEKAWKDPSFRQALRRDPRGAVQRELARIICHRTHWKHTVADSGTW
jgi:hypothetical protein